jgi:hypothetical protein
MAPHTNLYGILHAIAHLFYIFIYVFIYVFKLIVLFLILVWCQIYALRACLRNRRHTLRDEGLAIPLGGKYDPSA